MRSQKLLTWLTTVLENLLLGAFFGWANLEPILVKERFFSEGCPTFGNSSTSAAAGDSLSAVGSCRYQDESLALVYSIGAATGLISSLVVGWLLDRIGMWSTRTILINLAVISYISIAASGSSSVLYFAFPAINFAGLGLLLLNSQLNNLFANHRSLYSMTGEGAYSSAALVYLLFNRIYASGYSFPNIIYGYAVLVFLLNLRTFTLTPRRSVPYTLPDDYAYGYSDVCSARNDVVEEQISTDSEDPDGTSLKDAVYKLHTLTLFGAAMVTWFSSSFYISSFNMFLRSTLSEPTEANISLYTNTFGVIQSGSLLLAPLGGSLIDLARRRLARGGDMSEKTAGIASCAIGFTIGAFCLVIKWTCTLIPLASLQFVAMLAQVLARTFFYGSRTVFISILYPSSHFGKVFGILASICGLVTLLQYPLALLLTRVLDERFDGVHAVLLLLSSLTLLHPLVVWRLVKKAGGAVKVGEKKCDLKKDGKRGFDNPAATVAIDLQQL
ncbi:MAG: hypothetical protein AAFO91_05020 [Bacteroidota bacterium]